MQACFTAVIVKTFHKP